MQQPTTSIPGTTAEPSNSGHCARCNHPFAARIANKFEKVTGSYYQHLDESALGRIDLKPEGPTKELGPKNLTLQGW